MCIDGTSLYGEFMKKEIYKIIINDSQNGKTIKQILTNEMRLSGRIIKNIKNINGIVVNGSNQNINFEVKTNDLLQLYINDDISENIIPQEMELNILYEDDDLLIIDKPVGIVVHPTSFHIEGTLANGVMYHYNMNGLNTKFRPVNRLDKDTSGIILIAKTQVAHSNLSEQMINKIFKKQYISVVHNPFDDIDGTISLPIARKSESLIERIVSQDGKEAVTEYHVLCQNDLASIIQINLLTGRTHQIRVHFSHINHPLFGDDLYGTRDEFISRQALHCQKISFIHPSTRKLVEFESKIPLDMIELIKKLNLDYLL